MLYRLLAAVLLAGTTVTLAAAQSNVSFELSADTHTTAGASVSDIVSGDFNNDGKLDLIQCCGSNSLLFRAGNGDGTFRPPVTAVTGPLSNGGQSLVAADFNRDGKLDLAGLAGSGGLQLYIWYGNGDGTFQQAQVYATSAAGHSVAVGNFFKDGGPDLAVGEVNGNIDIFGHDAAGFVLKKSINLGGPQYNLLEIDAGDLNGSGVSDIAAAMTNTGQSGAVWVLWNDGRGNFTPVELDSYAEPAIHISRLNGIAQFDLIVGYTCNPQFTNGPGKGPNYNACAGFDVYYGQGGNKLYKRTVITDPGVFSAIDLRGIDLNGDGYGDIVATTSTSCFCSFGIFVWTGNADGSFQQTPQEFILSTDSAGPMAIGDFNRDGMMDIAVQEISDEHAEIALNSSSRAPCGTYKISPSVTACQPVDKTYSLSPVRVRANSYDTTPMTGMQEYIDGHLEYSQRVTSFNTTFPEGLGSHFFVTKGWDSSGRSFVADRTITVFNGTPGPVCPAAPQGAAICLPSGTSSSSPVQILANGDSEGTVPTAAQLYINGKLVINNQGYCYSNGNCAGGTTYIDTSQSLSSGNYDLVFKLWDAGGKIHQAEKTITVD